jgi:RNA polymerase sigma factor (TIGR02999 family)
MRMQSADQQDITRILDEIRQAPDQFERLIPMLYDDLRRIGHNQRRSAGFIAGPTLQTTALVNEAFLKLRGRIRDRIENRLHFQRLMAQVMRQLIIDYARRQMADKRGGQILHEPLDDQVAAPDTDSSFTLALEAAMQRLEQDQPRQAEILAASLFAGYTADEIAGMLELSERTVRREIAKGRAWLMMELEHEQ